MDDPLAVAAPPLYRGGLCLVRERVMPQIEFRGLPVIDTEEAETFTIAVKPEDIEEGDEADPGQHPIAIALRRQRVVDDARVSKREVLVRRGDQWNGAPKRGLLSR